MPPLDPNATEQGLLAQILLEQGKQTTSLAVIETKLDGVISANQDHESRIRSLERFKWILFGLWLAASAASGFAAYYIHR